MTEPVILNGQSGGILLICDHASNAVPRGIELGVDASLLDKHIAIDIGAGPLTEALAATLGAPGILATVSRLVIDLHRQPDHPGLIPTISDGHAIPGNASADRLERIARFHAPYHRALAALIHQHRPTLLASIHSFTPELESARAGPRPWKAGILYNRDTRAAHMAIDLLRAAGVETGDNQPYSGRQLNATLDRHGEAAGIPSLAIEIRNDKICDTVGVVRWCEILGPMLETIRNSLASKAPLAT